MIARIAVAMASVLLTGATADDSFTMRAAREMSDGELAARILQTPGPLANEVVIRDWTHQRFYFVAHSVAFEIEFAAAPVPTEFPGLCSAERTIASFGPYFKGFESTTPARLIHLQGARRFALLVDAMEAGVPPTAEQCGALGPVADAPYGRFFDPRYNRFEADALHVYEWIATFRKALRGDSEGDFEIVCREDPFAQYWKDLSPLCGNPREFLSRLRWNTLTYLSSRMCTGDLACVVASFARPGATEIMTMEVEVEIHVQRERSGQAKPEQAYTVKSMEIRGVTHVD